MANQTVNVIKRYVVGGKTSADLAREPAELHLGEFDGQLWASNRFWVTFASRVAPLLTQYNLAAEPGAFEVNGSVRRTSDKAPDFRRQLDQALDLYTERIAPVRIGCHAALVQLGKLQVAAYQTADGVPMGLPVEVTEWLTRLYELPVEDDQRYQDVRIMSKGHGGAPVIIVADLIRTITPYSHGTDPVTREPVHHDAVTEDLGSRIIGMQMAFKLDS